MCVTEDWGPLRPGSQIADQDEWLCATTRPLASMSVGSSIAIGTAAVGGIHFR